MAGTSRETVDAVAEPVPAGPVDHDQGIEHDDREAGPARASDGLEPISF